MAAVVLKMQRLEASRSRAPHGSFPQQGGLNSASPRWLLEPSAFLRASGNFPRKPQGYVGGRKVCLGLLSQPPSALHCLGAWGCLWRGLSLSQPRGHLLWSWPSRAAPAPGVPGQFSRGHSFSSGPAPSGTMLPYPCLLSIPSALFPRRLCGKQVSAPSCSLLFYLSPAPCTPAQQG